MRNPVVVVPLKSPLQLLLRPSLAEVNEKFKLLNGRRVVGDSGRQRKHLNLLLASPRREDGVTDSRGWRCDGRAAGLEG